MAIIPSTEQSRRLSSSYTMTVDSVTAPELERLRNVISETNVGRRFEGAPPMRVDVKARLGKNAEKYGHLYRGRGHRSYRNIASAHGDRFDVYVYVRNVY